MKKLFGTDGIRGVAGTFPLDPATIYTVGLALAHHLGDAPRLLIGQDTRESSDWIAAALTAGLTTGGATVESAGVIPTPAIAYLARVHGFSAAKTSGATELAAPLAQSTTTRCPSSDSPGTATSRNRTYSARSVSLTTGGALSVSGGESCVEAAS